MARTDLDICNGAIARIGGEPLDALDETSPLGAYCQANYPAKRELLLSGYRWTFATRFAQLARLATPPPGCPLANCFALPGDMLGNDVYAFRDGPSVDHRTVRCLISNVGVASNAGAVWAEYPALVPEAQWPPAFANFVSVAFAVDLAQRRPDNELAATLRVEAFGTPEQGGEGGLFLQVRSADTRAAPERQLFYDDPGPLIEARLGGFIGFAGRPIIVDASNG